MNFHQLRSAARTVAFIALLLGQCQSSAVELSQIERSIHRQPTYQTDSPKYCLLVFGTDAKKRVWLVQDGGVLYVDRNGNGDLTEDGEKIVAAGDSNAEEGVYQFAVGDVPQGDLTHKELHVDVIKLDYLVESDREIRAALVADHKARFITISLDVEMPGRSGQGVGGRVELLVSFRDVRGLLRLSSHPQDAPIIHFGGPWQITLPGPQELIRDRQADLLFGARRPKRGHLPIRWRLHTLR